MIRKSFDYRYYQINSIFDNQLDYIQNNIDQIDPRKPQDSNVRNLKVIRSRVDDVRKLIKDWEPANSDLKSLQIATITRLDDCIAWLDSYIETKTIKGLHETMRDLGKIYDYFTGSYAQ